MSIPKSRTETAARRLAALLDGSAWMLMVPAAMALWWLDPPMVKTLATWSLFFFLVTGIVLIISRIAFPDIKLTPFVDRAFYGSTAAAIVVASVMATVAFLVLAFVLWARPLGA